MGKRQNSLSDYHHNRIFFEGGNKSIKEKILLFSCDTKKTSALRVTFQKKNTLSRQTNLSGIKQASKIQQPLNRKSYVHVTY